MITMMLLCSMITPTKIWSLCEIICRYHCLCNHIHICKRCFVKCKICFTFAKDVSSNPSTVLHAVYPAHNCTSTMQQQTATQLVSGSSAKQGTHALVLPCHSQPHTMGQGSLAPLKAATINARLHVGTKHAVLVVLSPKTWGHGWKAIFWLHWQGFNHSFGPTYTSAQSGVPDMPNSGNWW